MNIEHGVLKVRVSSNKAGLNVKVEPMYVFNMVLQVIEEKNNLIIHLTNDFFTSTVLIYKN